MIVARSSGRTASALSRQRERVASLSSARPRSSTSASVRSTPAQRVSPKPITCSSVGSVARTLATFSASSGVETTIATDCESRRMNPTWSASSVG